ncbi:hypothetical protein NODU109028_10790 [Nocardioides dubius]|uniref:hypothetical protein n=1 Tax=Nocardioides dubius TaxID=317019 RepID=UPI0031E23F5D
MTNQSARAVDPQRRRIRRINAFVVLALLVGAVTIWLVQRDDALDPGAITESASDVRFAREAAFPTPGGMVRVRVSAPREEVEPAEYGQDAPRVRRGDRFVGIDVVANLDPGADVGLALVSDGERYPLDADREDAFWVVVDGEGTALAVELAYDGAEQRVDLDSGERDAGLAGDLEERYRSTSSCTVTATNPAGVEKPIQQWCPDLFATASTWNESGGWVDGADERWVSVFASPLRPLNLIGRWESLDVRDGAQVLVDGEPAEQQRLGPVALVPQRPRVVELRYRAEMYRSRDWTITVRMELEEVAR